MWKKRPKILQMRNFGWKFGVFFSVSGRDWLQCCHPLGTFQCPGAGRGRQQIWHDDEWWWMMIPNPNSWSVYVYLYIDTQDRYSSWSVVQGNCLPKAEEFPDFFGGWSQRRVSNHSLKFLKTTPTWKFEDGKSTEKKRKTQIPVLDMITFSFNGANFGSSEVTPKYPTGKKFPRAPGGWWNCFEKW